MLSGQPAEVRNLARRAERSVRRLGKLTHDADVLRRAYALAHADNDARVFEVCALSRAVLDALKHLHTRLDDAIERKLPRFRLD